MASEHWGRPVADANRDTASETNGFAGNSFPQKLENLVRKRLGRGPPVTETVENANLQVDIQYIFTKVDDHYVAKVHVLGRGFEGDPQPRKQAAKGSAAQVAIEELQQDAEG